MIILGIDPGSIKAGFGLIEKKGNKLHYLDSGVIRYSSQKSFMDKLYQIYQSGEELVEKYGPDQIAIESLIYVKNVSSMTKLSQARGAFCAALVKTHQGKLFEYAPNQIKASISSNGHTSKEGIKKMVQLILGKREFQTDDESDALAIALCHGSLRAPAGKNNGLNYYKRDRKL